MTQHHFLLKKECYGQFYLPLTHIVALGVHNIVQFLLKILLPATEFDNLGINIALHNRTINDETIVIDEIRVAYYFHSFNEENKPHL